jgi:4-amino-4-deoxy-L-arabinose transferase-like glycosyltransferase
MIDDLTDEQRGALGALKVARGGCPAAETLIAYDALEESARARHAAHAHIQICSRCQLVLLHAAEPTAAHAPSSLKWLLPLAAILVLGVAVTMVNRGGESVDPPVDTVRGTEIQAIGPVGSVDAITEFTWQSPIRAERYRVSVRRGSDRVWQTETSALRAVAPSGMFERNVEYRWQVEAIDREGDVRMTSPPQPFTVR